MKEQNLYKSFRFLDIFTLSDDLIIIKYNNQILLDIEEAQHLIKALLPLYELGFKHIVSDAQNPQLNITKEALDLFAKHTDGLDLNIKHAIVVIHPAMRLLAGFYLRFSKPSVPSKSFNSMDHAIAWLRSK
tara:strand:+ start:4997 stop:5389 length:393 start_codon:yes stop_codon:yes gene_type:complete